MLLYVTFVTTKFSRSTVTHLMTDISYHMAIWISIGIRIGIRIGIGKIFSSVLGN